MKRTRIRQRSRTNSRPEQNLELRVQYLDANPMDELSRHFPGIFGWRLEACDPHHIFCGAGRRWDLTSNLIALHRVTHDRVQQELGRVGTLLCLYVKSLKDELDPAEIRKASGQELAGWLEQDDTIRQCRDFSQQVEGLRLELVEWTGKQ